MSDRRNADPALAEARAILDGLIADARRGRTFWDGGPEWQRLRGAALRRLVVAPIRRLLSRAAYRVLAAKTRDRELRNRTRRSPGVGQL